MKKEKERESRKKMKKEEVRNIVSVCGHHDFFVSSSSYVIKIRKGKNGMKREKKKRGRRRKEKKRGRGRRERKREKKKKERKKRNRMTIQVYIHTHENHDS